MRSFFIFLIVLFLKFSIATSQTLQWAKQFGGAKSDIAFSNTIDIAGNSYITGYTDTSSIDIFICKLDSNGNILWNKIIGGMGVDASIHITTDSLCNIYVCGVFNDSVDFDPGTGISSLISQSLGDAYLLKLDSGGNFVWVRQMGCHAFYENGSRFCKVNGPYIYWCGVFNDTLFYTAQSTSFPVAISQGLIDIFIAKLNTAGNFIWTKSQGGLGSDGIVSVAIDDADNIITTGGFTGICDFNPDSTVNFDLTSLGNTDVYVCKLDSGGNFIWVKQFGGVNFEVPCELVTDKAGNIFLAGVFEGIMDADPNSGIYNLVSNGNYDNFILKLDSSGNMQWALSFGGTGLDVCNSLALDSSANIYTTGRFVDTVDFDPGMGVYNLVCNNSFGDTFVNKIDSAGNLIWANQLVGTIDNMGNSIALDNNLNIYVAGNFSNSCDFDPSGNFYTLNSLGPYDAYLFKWSQSLTGLHDTYTNSSVKVFPNPFAETVQINVIEKATVTISTITGQVILKSNLSAGLHSINLSNHIGGTYLLNVLTDKSSSNAVIVKSN
jgi:hypothetical protein